MNSRPSPGSRGAASTRRWIPLALVVLAVGLRVAYVVALRDHPRFAAPAMDAGYHLGWAKALASGAEFQDGPFFRAPLYPLVLGAVVALTPDGTLVPRLLQALLGGLATLLTYRVGRRAFGEGTAVIGAALVAVSWVLVAFDAELLIPTLLVPLLLAALDRAIAWDGEDRPRSALVTGLLFGLAAIARPNVLLFMPVLFAWTIVRTRKVRAAAALTVGTLLPILPVTLHNALEGDTALIATQGGVNLWIGNNPTSDGASAIVPGTRDGWWEGFDDAIAQAEAAEGRALRPTEVSSHYVGRTREWVTSEPGAALAHLGWKARLLVTNVELANNQDIRFTAFRTLPLLRFSPSRWDVLLGLGSVGLVLGVLRRRRGAGVLLAFSIVYGLSIILFFVTARFRAPLLPVLAIGAGFAVTEVIAAARARRWGALAGVLGPALVIAALSNVVPAAIDTTDAAGNADLGRAELARGEPARALGYLEAATRLNPSSVQIRMALANAVLAATGDAARALRVLEEARALPLGRDSADLATRILDLRVAAGDAEGALVATRAALGGRPGDGALRHVAARAEAALGRPAVALALLTELRWDEPTNVSVAIAVSQLTTALRPRDAARAAWDHAAALRAYATPAEIATIEQALAALD